MYVMQSSESALWVEVDGSLESVFCTSKSVMFSQSSQKRHKLSLILSACFMFSVRDQNPQLSLAVITFSQPVKHYS